MDKHVPSKIVKKNVNNPGSIMASNNYKGANKKLQQSKSISNSASDWANYKVLKKSMQAATRQAFNGYMYKMIHNSYHNGKKIKIIDTLNLYDLTVPAYHL